MAVMGLVLFSTMALASPVPAERHRLSRSSPPACCWRRRGCGTFVAMMLVGRMMRYIEARTLIISGLALTCISLFYMTGWTDQTGVHRDRDNQHHPGFRLRAGIRAVEHGGVPDAAQPSAHRRHLDADLDAQRRQFGRHFPRDCAIDRGIAARLFRAVATRQSVQPRHADASRQKSEGIRIRKSLLAHQRHAQIESRVRRPGRRAPPATSSRMASSNWPWCISTLANRCCLLRLELAGTACPDLREGVLGRVEIAARVPDLRQIEPGAIAHAGRAHPASAASRSARPPRCACRATGTGRRAAAAPRPRDAACRLQCS